MSRHQSQEGPDVEIIWQRYFKMFQAIKANIPAMNENRKYLQRKQKIYKKELNGNLELKNRITTKENLTGHNNVIEATEEGVKESVELKIDQ